MCVGGGFRSNGFMTKMQLFPMDGHYRTYIISSVSHPRSNEVVPLVLRTVCCEMAGARALYYRSLGTTSTMLRRNNISSRLYYYFISYAYITHISISPA